MKVRVTIKRSPWPFVKSSIPYFHQLKKRPFHLSNCWRPPDLSVKQAHRTEDVPVESLNYLKRGALEIFKGNLGLTILKPCEAVGPHFPRLWALLIFLFISNIKALKYNCLSRLSPQNISNPPLYQSISHAWANFSWTGTWVVIRGCSHITSAKNWSS